MTSVEIETALRAMGATYVSGVLTATQVALRVHVEDVTGALVVVTGEGVTLADAVESAARKVAARAG